MGWTRVRWRSIRQNKIMICEVEERERETHTKIRTKLWQVSCAWQHQYISQKIPDNAPSASPTTDPWALCEKCPTLLPQLCGPWDSWAMRVETLDCGDHARHLKSTMDTANWLTFWCAATCRRERRADISSHFSYAYGWKRCIQWIETLTITREKWWEHLSSIVVGPKYFLATPWRKWLCDVMW